MSKSRHVFDYQHSLSYSGKKRVRVYENDDDETLKAKGKPTAAEIVSLRATDVQAYLLGSLEKISRNAWNRRGAMEELMRSAGLLGGVAL